MHDNKDSKPPRLEAVQTQVVSKHSSQTLLTNGRTLIYLGSITSRRESAPSSAFHIEHSIPNYPGRPCSKIGPIERQTSPDDCRPQEVDCRRHPVNNPADWPSSLQLRSQALRCSPTSSLAANYVRRSQTDGGAVVRPLAGPQALHPQRRRQASLESTLGVAAPSTASGAVEPRERAMSWAGIDAGGHCARRWLRATCSCPRGIRAGGTRRVSALGGEAHRLRLCALGDPPKCAAQLDLGRGAVLWSRRGDERPVEWCRNS